MARRNVNERWRNRRGAAFACRLVLKGRDRFHKLLDGLKDLAKEISAATPF